MFSKKRTALVSSAIAALLSACTYPADVNRSSLGSQEHLQNQVNGLAVRFARQTDETVYFTTASNALDETARHAIAGQVRWINAHPSVVFGVYGHTDLVGDHQSNRHLGMARAQAVVEYMVALGVDQSRLVLLSSLGEDDPFVQTTTSEALNRRATTLVSGFVEPTSPLPTGDQSEANLLWNTGDDGNPQHPGHGSGQGGASNQVSSSEPDSPPAESPETVASQDPEQDSSGRGKGKGQGGQNGPSENSQSDNSDANGKGGNKHDQTDKDGTQGSEIAEGKH